MEAVQDILKKFSAFTCMRTNIEKSLIFYSKSCMQQIKENLVGIIEILASEFPIKYLGLPLTSRRLKHGQCGRLISSLEKTLSRSQDKKLSSADRIQNSQLGVWWECEVLDPGYKTPQDSIEATTFDQVSFHVE